MAQRSHIWYGDITGTRNPSHRGGDRALIRRPTYCVHVANWAAAARILRQGFPEAGRQDIHMAPLRVNSSQDALGEPGSGKNPPFDPRWSHSPRRGDNLFQVRKRRIRSKWDVGRHSAALRGQHRGGSKIGACASRNGIRTECTAGRTGNKHEA